MIHPSPSKHSPYLAYPVLTFVLTLLTLTTPKILNNNESELPNCTTSDDIGKSLLYMIKEYSLKGYLPTHFCDTRESKVFKIIQILFQHLSHINLRIFQHSGLFGLSILLQFNEEEIKRL